VSHVDDCIGRILTALDDLGLANDTLVLFTSDHGENLGDHGLVGKTQWYDSSTRVPLIVKPPRRQAAPGAPSTTSRPDLVTDGFVELVDLAPTIADYCAVPRPSFFQGQSLRPVIDGRGQRGSPDIALRDSAFFEYGLSGGPGYKAVRTDEYLYARHHDGRERIYDLAADPGQTIDLLAGSAAGTPAPVRDLLNGARAELLSRLIGTESPFPRPTGEY
jgi:arylsulfatase A-like enzyme